MFKIWKIRLTLLVLFQSIRSKTPFNSIREKDNIKIFPRHFVLFKIVSLYRSGRYDPIMFSYNCIKNFAHNITNLTGNEKRKCCKIVNYVLYYSQVQIMLEREISRLPDMIAPIRYKDTVLKFLPFMSKYLVNQYGATYGNVYDS